MATPRLGLVVEDKPTELSCMYEIRKRMHAHYSRQCAWQGVIRTNTIEQEKI